MSDETPEPTHSLDDFYNNPDKYHFGVITQEGYRELQRKLDKQAQDTHNQFRRWFITGLIAFTIIGLTSVIGLVGFGFLITKQNHTTHDIQQQRRDTVRGNCVDQNERHDRTTKALIRAMKFEIKKHPEHKKRIIQNSQVSLGLIGLLAPYRDCDDVVREATQTKEGK